MSNPRDRQATQPTMPFGGTSYRLCGTIPWETDINPSMFPYYSCKVGCQVTWVTRIGRNLRIMYLGVLDRSRFNPDPHSIVL